MNICILFGSPRKNGNTASLLRPYTEELKNAGASVTVFDVYEMDIAGCRACRGCQKDTTRAYCVIRDDMQSILDAVTAAELIVLAGPIYCWGLPGPLKTVLDRMIYPFCKFYGGDPHGPALLQGKGVALLTTCGYPVDRAADLCQESLRRIAKHCGMRYCGMLAERQRNLDEPFMDAEKESRARVFARALLQEGKCEAENGR